MLVHSPCGLGVGTAAVLDTLVSGLLYKFEDGSKSAQPAGQGWGGAYPPASPRGGIPPGLGYLHRTLNEGDGPPRGLVVARTLGEDSIQSRGARRPQCADACRFAELAGCACAVSCAMSSCVLPHAHARQASSALCALLASRGRSSCSSLLFLSPGVIVLSPSFRSTAPPFIFAQPLHSERGSEFSWPSRPRMRTQRSRPRDPITIGSLSSQCPWSLKLCGCESLVGNIGS